MLHNLTNELNNFDHVRWAVACRHMQIRLLHGDVEAAKSILSAFYHERSKVKARLNSPVHCVFEQRVADIMVADLAVKTVGDAACVRDEVYLQTVGLSDTSLIAIRRTVVAVKQGLIYEDWGTSEIDELDEPAAIELAVKSEVSDRAARRSAREWINRKPSKKYSA